MDSISKNTLFDRAKIWALSRFNSNKDALQTEDKESGLLFYNGILKVAFLEPYVKKNDTPFLSTINYFFNMKLYLRDAKAKIIIDQISFREEAKSIPIEDYRNYSSNKISEIFKKLKGYKIKVNDNYPSEYQNNLTSSYQLCNATFVSMIEDFENTISSKSEADF